MRRLLVEVAVGSAQLTDLDDLWVISRLPSIKACYNNIEHAFGSSACSNIAMIPACERSCCQLTRFTSPLDASDQVMAVRLSWGVRPAPTHWMGSPGGLATAVDLVKDGPTALPSSAWGWSRTPGLLA